MEAADIDVSQCINDGYRRQFGRVAVASKAELGHIVNG